MYRKNKNPFSNGSERGEARLINTGFEVPRPVMTPLMGAGRRSKADSRVMHRSKRVGPGILPQQLLNQFTSPPFATAASFAWG